MNINTPFRTEKWRHYTFAQAKLKIINRLKLRKKDFGEFDSLLSVNRIDKRVLVGHTTGLPTEIKGKLYKELLNLDLPPNPSADSLSPVIENKILQFVQKYAIPMGTAQEMEIDFRNIDKKEKRDKPVFINWLFIPFESDLSEKGSDFFRSFWLKWIDFKKSYEAVKSGDTNAIFQMSGIINQNLQDTYPILKTPSLLDKQYHVSMEAKTSLSLCYLEIYNLLINQQQIKTCPYCGKDFVSKKSNRTVCKKCRTFGAYKKRYYERNKIIQQKKARERMRRNREMQKLKVLTTA